MSRSKLTIALMLMGSAAAWGQVPQPSAQMPDIPTNLKQYFVAMYVKGANADQPQTPEERTAWARKHLAYLRTQVEAGKYLIVGPFTDNDRVVRGMAVIRAATAAEASEIANADPGVTSGRMAIEIHAVLLPDLSPVHVVYLDAAGK